MKVYMVVEGEWIAQSRLQLQNAAFAGQHAGEPSSASSNQMNIISSSVISNFPKAVRGFWIAC